MRSKRVILDTNLWISFLVSKRYDFLDSLINDSRIRLIFSAELIEEFIEVARRPKFSRFFTEQDIKKLLEYFDNYGRLVEVMSGTKVCRDPKDNFLINLAIDSKADYLLTGDDDLLILQKIKKTKILKWTDFVNEFK